MNAIPLRIRDTTGSGKVLNEIEVLLKDRITVKELIEARVVAEVTRYNDTLGAYFQGLVQPTHAEMTLNGYKMKGRKKVDPEKQVYVALNAFLLNGYFILVDTFQVCGLDEEVDISRTTQINFVKLTPLVGG